MFAILKNLQFGLRGYFVSLYLETKCWNNSYIKKKKSLEFMEHLGSGKKSDIKS